MALPEADPERPKKGYQGTVRDDSGWQPPASMCLFVGGPEDGVRRRVPVDVTTYLFKRIGKPDLWYTAHYIGMADNIEVRVFAPRQMGIGEIAQMMCDGYHSAGSRKISEPSLFNRPRRVFDFE